MSQFLIHKQYLLLSEKDISRCFGGPQQTIAGTIICDPSKQLNTTVFLKIS